MKRFAVVILNWNGANDTLECLRSLARSDPTALPIIVDNGSIDDSAEKLLTYLCEGQSSVIAGTLGEICSRSDAIATAGSVLALSRENLGFAAGCNLGLKIAVDAGIEFTVFLNNDTVLDQGALTLIVDRLRDAPELFATLPLLMIHNTDTIWNCGGRIYRFGFRRYYFAGKKRIEVRLPPEIPCSFFTGCCFAVRTLQFAERGGFTERFFFGEEDFELALWMKDMGYASVCLTKSVVHHKVGASVSRASGANQEPKVFVHYLNRFIHMRLRFGVLRWILWLTLYLPYVAMLLVLKRIVAPLRVPGFIAGIVRRAAKIDCVSRDEFQRIMKSRKC